MITSLKQVIRPTEVVRRILRQQGAPSYRVFTNKYKHCYTVKAYVGDIEDVADCISDVTLALSQLGVTGFSIRQLPGQRMFDHFDSFIVRIPF